jgi:hypothetical protein
VAVIDAHARAFCRITPFTRRFYEVNLGESVNWTWGLSLIALTIAIHAMCVVLMALVGIGIRHGWRIGSSVYGT